MIHNVLEQFKEHTTIRYSRNLIKLFSKVLDK